MWFVEKKSTKTQSLPDNVRHRYVGTAAPNYRMDEKADNTSGMFGKTQ